MLARGRGEHRAYLSDQFVLRPQVTGLIDEILHLRRHIAEPRRCPKDDGIVIDEIVDLRDRSDLVELVVRGESDLAWHELRHALDVHIAASATCSVGLGEGHPFDMPITRIVKHQYLGHAPLRRRAQRAISGRPAKPAQIMQQVAVTAP